MFVNSYFILYKYRKNELQFLSMNNIKIIILIKKHFKNLIFSTIKMIQKIL